MSEEGTRRLNWVCNEITPYHDVLFAYLARNTSIDLRVFIVRSSSATHPYRAFGQLPYVVEELASFRGLGRLFKSIMLRKDGWLLAGYSSRLLLLSLFSLIAFNRAFIFWTDTPLSDEIAGTLGKKRKRSFIQKLVRRLLWHLINVKASYILSTGRPGIESLLSLGCDNSKIMSLPYWVRIYPYVVPSIEDWTRRRSFCCLGQLIERKAYDVAIRAFATAITNGLPDGFSLEIGGAGPLEHKLSQLAVDLGIDARVSFLGWLHPKEKIDLFNRSVAFVHPARWEAYGVVVLEAMERGVPVLASHKTCAALDRIIDGESGYLHTVGDVPMLASQMLEVAINCDKAARMGSRARETAEMWPVERGAQLVDQILSATHTSRR